MSKAFADMVVRMAYASPGTSQNQQSIVFKKNVPAKGSSPGK
jgi:hypothetical protein